VLAQISNIEKLILQLWEATLSNAPSIVPQLLDLFPYLVGIMNRSFDHLEVRTPTPRKRRMDTSLLALSE
jgi:hypothetical protein